MAWKRQDTVRPPHKGHPGTSTACRCRELVHNVRRDFGQRAALSLLCACFTVLRHIVRRALSLRGACSPCKRRPFATRSADEPFRFRSFAWLGSTARPAAGPAVRRRALPTRDCARGRTCAHSGYVQLYTPGVACAGCGSTHVSCAVHSCSCRTFKTVMKTSSRSSYENEFHTRTSQVMHQGTST